MTSNRLLFSGPTFWEDTDRGNLNIYYTSDQEQIESFKKLLYSISETQLKQRSIKKYQFNQYLVISYLHKFCPELRVYFLPEMNRISTVVKKIYL